MNSDDPNNVHLGGRATQKPTLRYTAAGTPVSEFSLAIHREVMDDGGRTSQEVIFVTCLAYREEAIGAAAVIHRGSQVDLVGRLWTAPRAQGKGRELVVVVENLYAGGGVRREIEIPLRIDKGADDDTQGEGQDGRHEGGEG